MTYDEIFEMMYRTYRAEATTPASTDDEYKIGLTYANEAIRRWQHYDNTFWNELFTDTNLTGDGVTIAADTTDYDAPDDFQEPGGFLRIVDSDGNTQQRIPIIAPQEVQFKGDDVAYCYFTGDQANGFTLHLNPTPVSPIVGMTGHFDYYKTPTFFTTGTDVTEMSNPMFMVHRMLYHRFRASRNPYATDALRDSEDMLKVMQMTNNSGSYANPWKVQDNSGSRWGW